MSQRQKLVSQAEEELVDLIRDMLTNRANYADAIYSARKGPLSVRYGIPRTKEHIRDGTVELVITIKA